MDTFDPQNTSNRERPAPDDPEAPFYTPNSQTGNNTAGAQRNTGYGPGFGYRPEMDPDGFANQAGGWQGGPGWRGGPGWQGRPGWQPWSGGYYRYRHGHNFWKVLLLILLVALLIGPVLRFTFALAGFAFVVLLLALPFVILGLILSHFFGWGHRGWGGGGHWHRW